MADLNGGGGMAEVDMYGRQGDAGSGSPYHGGTPSRAPGEAPPPVYADRPHAAASQDLGPPTEVPSFNKGYISSYNFGTRVLKWLFALIAVIIAADFQNWVKHLRATDALKNDVYNPRLSYIEFVISMVLIFETMWIVLYLSNFIIKIPEHVRQYMMLAITVFLFLATFIGGIVSSQWGLMGTGTKGFYYHYFPALTVFQMMLAILYTLDCAFIYPWLRGGREYDAWPCCGATSS